MKRDMLLWRALGLAVALWVAAPQSSWATESEDGPLEGNLMNLVGAPNRYGLPAFFELHVWAWEHNPKRAFADWNTKVTCEHQRIN
jgi:hypothetical protein